MTEPTLSEIHAEILADLQAGTTKKPKRRSILVDSAPEHYNVIAAAAQERDLSLSSYMRRAAIAFAVADLGVDWVEVQSTEPMVHKSNGRRTNKSMMGYGHGAWKIEGLSTYERPGDDDGSAVTSAT